ncbi:hypothetical protein CASFOL_028281 [Castilleja foliolosa]|uniref:Uncharacterized protein n=1 Tax=Castilleja foliolosa TaxID=1961234 RepID=A0ABD3CFQ3_9LAMI
MLKIWRRAVSDLDEDCDRMVADSSDIYGVGERVDGANIVG